MKPADGSKRLLITDIGMLTTPVGNSAKRGKCQSDVNQILGIINPPINIIGIKNSIRYSRNDCVLIIRIIYYNRKSTKCGLSLNVVDTKFNNRQDAVPHSSINLLYIKNICFKQST